ncbi:hypothetical protein O6H91_01G021400 [Diphasiastrum complanatum]|uniref:Uncharacterized protein n=1 Tax=Diphasiastrum complanatum TaxID=34168 RepID=A0ACC2EP37_DIPCM|nr:hypothetical protein O6H91_01G021400 [Diphasiastrum complanatum]
MEHSGRMTGSATNGSRPRDSSPERRPRGCWSGIWSIGKIKRGKRIVPALESQELSVGAWGTILARAPENSNQLTSLSLSLLAPPSSPASFANSRIMSSIQSPASFNVSLSATSDNAISPGGIGWDRTTTMFTIGPYAHETALVTPPAFSAFTTAPSTAPFTPPPELAHFTRPPSPDVPFSKLLASSLRKTGAIEHSAAPSSAPQCVSPDHLVDYHCNQLPLDSLVDQLVLPTSGVSGSEPCSASAIPVSPSQESSSKYLCEDASCVIAKPDEHSSTALAHSATPFFSHPSNRHFHNSGSSEELELSNKTASAIKYLDLGCQGVSGTIFPEEYADSCSKNGEDCIKNIVANHLNKQKSGYESKFLGMEETLLERNSKDPNESWDVYKELLEASLTSSSIDHSYEYEGPSRRNVNMESFCHRGFEDSGGPETQCWCTPLLSGGNVGETADSELMLSENKCDFVNFELSSRNLQRTLSNGSISYAQPISQSTSMHFGDDVSKESGFVEAEIQDPYWEIPRISFSAGNSPLSTELGKNTYCLFLSRANGDAVQLFKTRKLYCSCKLALALKKSNKKLLHLHMNTDAI